MSRFEHKTAETNWRGMGASDRQTFSNKAGTKRAEGTDVFGVRIPTWSLKLSTIIKVVLVAVLCLTLYSCLGGSEECVPAVRCAD